MRIAVVGKGGVGKSVVAGTMARLLGRRGRRVLALDSDLMPGLAYSLGVAPGAVASLGDAAERSEAGRWRLRKGIGPARAVQRYSVLAPDGVRLLEAGKLTAEGLGPVMGSVSSFYAVVHRLSRARALADWDIVGDLPAGPRQTAFAWAPYATTFLVLVEPTWKGALTARRVARIARAQTGVTVHAVATKVTGPEDPRRLEEMLEEPVIAAIPADQAVREADRLGAPLLEHAPASGAVLAIERLVDELSRADEAPSSLARVGSR